MGAPSTATGNAWDAAPLPSNRGNIYRPVGTPKGSDGFPAPPTADKDGAVWTVGGDANWGTGTMTKKVLDSNKPKA